MSAKTNTAIKVSAAWLEYPIVKRAIQKSGSTGDGVDGLSVLCELSDMLNDLEDRCPGVNYQSLFELPNETDPVVINQVRCQMQALGVSDDLINALGGLNEATREATAVDYAERSTNQQIVLAALERGVTLNRAAQEAGVSWRTAKRYSQTGVLPKMRDGSRTNEIGWYAVTNGYKAAMEFFEVSKSHALNCRKKIETGVSPKTAWRRTQKGAA